MKEDKPAISYSGAAGIYVALGRSGKVMLGAICIALMPIFLEVIIFSPYKANPIMSLLVTGAIGLPILFLLTFFYLLCMQPIDKEITMAHAAIQQKETWEEDIDDIFFGCVVIASITLTLAGLLSVITTYYFNKGPIIASFVGLGVCGLGILLAILGIIASSKTYKSGGQKRSLLSSTRRYAQEERNDKDMFKEAKEVAKTIIDPKNETLLKNPNEPR